MKKFTDLLLVLTAFTIVILLVSCQTDDGKDKPKKMNSANPDDFPVYPKIKEAKLKLELMTPRRSFYAGDDVELSFKLTNLDTKEILIYEWMANEADNLKVYYHIYRKDLKTFDRRKWKFVEPVLPEKPKRTPLSLSPKGSALINVKLPFIKEIDPSTLKKGGVKYYIVAELNLGSVFARSRVAIVKVK
jgi:hypothetical protein